MNIQIHQPSFFIGFAAGILFLWFWRLLGPTLKELKRSVRGRVGAVQTGLSGSLELRYRQDLIRFLQTNHLTSSLFSLEDIGVEPRFLPPLPHVIPGEELPPDDAYSLTIPYLPDWPELAAGFNAPTIEMPLVVQSMSDLAFIGKPGIGKSFALHFLALRLARKDPSYGRLSQLIPVIIHIGDLNLNKKRKTTVSLLYDAIKEHFSPAVEAQLDAFLEKSISQNAAILLVDGFDELPAEQFDPYLDYLEELKSLNSALTIIITASTDCIPHREGLIFSPMALAAFDSGQKATFIRQWYHQWRKHISSQSWAKQLPPPPTDVHLTSWLASDLSVTNPTFLTLKVWSIFNGDILGASPADAAEAYVRRMTFDMNNARPALEQLAVQVSLSRTPFIERKQAGKSISQYEDFSTPSDLDSFGADEAAFLDEHSDQEINLAADELNELDNLEIPTFENDSPKKDSGVSARIVRRMLPEMVKNKILTYRSEAEIGFSHALIAGYLAGCGLNNLGGEFDLLSQPDWPGKRTALLFLSGKKDMSMMIEGISHSIRTEKLRSGLSLVGGWPSISNGKPPWRSQLMRLMASSVTDHGLPIGVRSQAVAALAASGDTGVSTLFRQLLNSPDVETQIVASFGAGLIRDLKAITRLNELQFGGHPGVRRAACLALITIGSTESIEMAASALLHGEDDVRRAAAEAFASLPNEGHAMLKEGAEMEDLSVRRAVTFGLGRIDDSWSREVLERMQIEDEQWIVRTTAGQVLEAQQMGRWKTSIPKKLGELSDTPWLISFASEQGMGLAPGEGAWNMLIKALREGNEDQKLAAMEIYRLSPDEARSVVPILLELMQGNNHEIREAAYHTLWQISRYGVQIYD